MSIWGFIVLGLIAFIAVYAVIRWRNSKAEHEETPQEKAARLWATLESEIDEEYERAMKLWPIVRKTGLFWYGAFFTIIMIVLDVAFAFSQSGQNVTTITFWVLAGIFIAADLTLPYVAVTSDKTSAPFWRDLTTEGGARDRSISQWALIAFFTLMSIIVVIGSTADTSSTVTARNDADVRAVAELKSTIEAKQQLRDQIAARRAQEGNAMSREALEKTAAEWKAKAEREAGRGGCETICEAHKAEALIWRNKADDAAAQEELTKELAVLTHKLKNTSNLRTDADPLADFGADALGVPREVTSKWLLTVLGVFVVIGGTMLWLIIAHRVQLRVARLAERNSAIADKKRELAGMPAKYTAGVEPPAGLLPHIEAEASDGDTIVVNVSDSYRVLMENDPDLVEVNLLFGKLVEAKKDAALDIAALYKAYKIDVLRGNHAARYMTQPVFVTKLNTISQNRPDVAMTADGRLLGWQLVPAEAPALVAAE